ncbi:Free methionine-R-sulfoxide reductase [bioreactor metagenome]|uniref:Free methionine-R-sulfoxide reductase n=1 Tax=bioreactor metagenome TaxID=1076179 RepID=A0A645CV63_9ZZZZ
MNKTARYNRIATQLGELTAKSPSAVSAMATVAAVLFNKLPHFSWCGFYYLCDGELIAGPYQGPVACQVLRKHTGVCWAAIDRNQSMLVPDVEKFPGHIACDSRTKSEVVIPVHDVNGNVVAVLDVDSHSLNAFDEEDLAGLQTIVKLIEPIQL